MVFDGDRYAEREVALSLSLNLKLTYINSLGISATFQDCWLTPAEIAADQEAVRFTEALRAAIAHNQEGLIRDKSDIRVLGIATDDDDWEYDANDVDAARGGCDYGRRLAEIDLAAPPAEKLVESRRSMQAPSDGARVVVLMRVRCVRAASCEALSSSGWDGNDMFTSLRNGVDSVDGIGSTAMAATADATRFAWKAESVDATPDLEFGRSGLKGWSGWAPYAAVYGRTARKAQKVSLGQPGPCANGL
eukprot:SAG11_NODE_4393_length_1916_cov_0.840947_1_plen_248_part_00